MTDNEIIKALEFCVTGRCDTGECAYYNRDDVADCVEQSILDAIFLINRQKEKIELLNLENLQMIASIKHLKAEAAKEFAERLEKKLFPYGMPDNGNYGINAKAVKVALDKTKEEMVGESNG